VNDAHVDVLGVVLTVAGLAAVARGRSAGGGTLLGAAIAVKIIPALVVPGAMSGMLARRPRARDLVVPVTAGAVCALTYLPYVIASGTGVLGYLPGYLKEEGYDSAQIQRFALLRVVVPESTAPFAAVVVLLLAVLFVLRFGDPLRPWKGALLVFGVMLFALTPGYPWYALTVVGLVALDGGWEWLAVPVAGQVAYSVHGHGVPVWAYGCALAVVVAGRAVRFASVRRAGSRSLIPGRAGVPVP
jgi:hypothetical protein